MKIGIKNEYDCQCSFCKHHKCVLNQDETKCLDPRCECNKPKDGSISKQKVREAVEKYVTEYYGEYCDELKDMLIKVLDL